MLRKFGKGWKRDLIHKQEHRKSDLNGTQTNEFAYTPLREDDEIRILNIAPRNRPASASRLQGSLRHVKLSASPLYTAVSWMWGDPHDLVSIIVDGHKLKIQRNLSRILNYLQDDNYDRQVWIDAICIDQKSLRERNHQVQLMGRIYNNANYVVACIISERTSERQSLRRDAEDLHKFLSNGQDSASTERYRYLFGNRYFTRRWIIQELAQAQQVIFCCEGHQMPLKLIRDGFEKTRLRTKPKTGEAYARLSQAEKVAEGRAIQLCRSSSATQSMEELLYIHEDAQCSDFHDKIYALLSLTSQAQNHLLVDYDINKVQLMLLTLHVSSTYEALSVFRTLSFVFFLRQHLGISYDDLRKGIATPGSAPSTVFGIRGIVRGSIQTLATRAEVEETGLKLRKELPGLTARPVILLKPREATGASNIADFSTFKPDNSCFKSKTPHTLAQISGIDQCLFEFVEREPIHHPAGVTKDEIELPDTQKRSNTPMMVGFASTRVEIGDEIWQFERTPVAIVARRTSQGWALVGRALLISSSSLQPKSADGHEEQSQGRLDWIRDGTKYRHLTPFISTDMEGLYEFMTWANLDL